MLAIHNHCLKKNEINLNVTLRRNNKTKLNGNVPNPMWLPLSHFSKKAIESIKFERYYYKAMTYPNDIDYSLANRMKLDVFIHKTIHIECLHLLNWFQYNRVPPTAKYPCSWANPAGPTIFNNGKLMVEQSKHKDEKMNEKEMQSDAHGINEFMSVPQLRSHDANIDKVKEALNQMVAHDKTLHNENNTLWQLCQCCQEMDAAIETIATITSQWYNQQSRKLDTATLQRQHMVIPTLRNWLIQSFNAGRNTIISDIVAYRQHLEKYAETRNKYRDMVILLHHPHVEKICRDTLSNNNNDDQKNDDQKNDDQPPKKRRRTLNNVNDNDDDITVITSQFEQIQLNDTIGLLEFVCDDDEYPAIREQCQSLKTIHHCPIINKANNANITLKSILRKIFDIKIKPCLLQWRQWGATDIAAYLCWKDKTRYSNIAYAKFLEILRQSDLEGKHLTNINQPTLKALKLQDNQHQESVLKHLEELTKTQNNRCAVCLTDRATMLVIPCGHICICKDCKEVYVLKFQECPSCKQKIDQIITFFGFDTKL